MQPEGAGLLAAGAGYSAADGFWKRDGEPVRYDAEHRQVVSYLYGEYGYSYYYNLFASTAWVESRRDSGEDSGMDDVRIGIRGRLNVFRNGRTWQLAAVIPLRKSDASGYRPGEGEYALEAGAFLRLLPDRYDNPFTAYPDSIWGFGLGATLRSGGAGSELWTYGKWEKNVVNPAWKLAVKLSALSSFAGAESGSVDAFGPNDTYHYDRVASDVALSHSLSRTTGVRFSYKRDLWGRNVNRDEGVNFGFHMMWGK